MLKKVIRFVILTLSLVIFIFSTAAGTKLRPKEITYCSGFINDGKFISTNIIAHTGFEEKDRSEAFSGSFGIPKDMRIELKFRAHAGSGYKIYVLFRDPEGNVIYEGNHTTIEFTKTITAKEGKCDFIIKGNDIKAGNFRFSVVEK